MVKAEDLSCWKCGTSLAGALLPLTRLAKCKACHADLHVCRMCRFYDPAVANSCREPVAESVKEKGRANFCGYLQPATDAYAKQPAGAAAASSELDALFGLPATTDDHAALSESDRSRQELERLFGLGGEQEK